MCGEFAPIDSLRVELEGAEDYSMLVQLSSEWFQCILIMRITVQVCSEATSTSIYSFSMPLESSSTENVQMCSKWFQESNSRFRPREPGIPSNESSWRGEHDSCYLNPQLPISLQLWFLEVLNVIEFHGAGRKKWKKTRAASFHCSLLFYAGVGMVPPLL